MCKIEEDHYGGIALEFLCHDRCGGRCLAAQGANTTQVNIDVAQSGSLSIIVIIVQCQIRMEGAALFPPAQASKKVPLCRPERLRNG